MRATLLFPDREIVERFYVPIMYTACRTCYSEQDPQEIFRRAVAGDFREHARRFVQRPGFSSSGKRAGHPCRGPGNRPWSRAHAALRCG